jgi:hypothetical protein
MVEVSDSNNFRVRVAGKIPCGQTANFSGADHAKTNFRHKFLPWRRLPELRA